MSNVGNFTGSYINIDTRIGLEGMNRHSLNSHYQSAMILIDVMAIDHGDATDTFLPTFKFF